MSWWVFRRYLGRGFREVNIGFEDDSVRFDSYIDGI